MKLTKLALMLCFAIGISTTALAQNAQATLSKSGAVVLPESETLKSAYEIDASLFNFESNEEAIDYLQSKNSKEVSYRPVLHNGIIMVYLQLKQNPDWTTAQWNAYFAENRIRNTELMHNTNQSSN